MSGKPKTINCKWCGMGHQPRSDGNHWIVKSIIPARITIVECAYHKAGTVSPIVKPDDPGRPVPHHGSGP